MAPASREASGAIFFLLTASHSGCNVYYNVNKGGSMKPFRPTVTVNYSIEPDKHPIRAHIKKHAGSYKKTAIFLAGALFFWFEVGRSEKIHAMEASLAAAEAKVVELHSKIAADTAAGITVPLITFNTVDQGRVQLIVVPIDYNQRKGKNGR
jgi:hypothetical protein